MNMEMTWKLFCVLLFSGKFLHNHGTTRRLGGFSPPDYTQTNFFSVFSSLERLGGLGGSLSPHIFLHGIVPAQFEVTEYYKHDLDT